MTDVGRPRRLARDAPPSAGGTPPLRIVIVDDHPIVRRGLTELINHESDMAVVGESATLDDGFDRIQAQRPDVAIVDLSVGLTSGLDLVTRLNAALPAVRVLMLSMHDETLYAERALAAGAGGYVMKDQAMESLIGAIRQVADGKIHISDQVAARIIARVTQSGRTTDERSPMERLTDREREVFALVGRGLDTRAVATELTLSVKTVETYYARIKEKLGLKGAHELIRTAVSWTKP